MTAPAPHRESGFRFLFRTDQGTIDRATWWRGMALILAPIAAFYLGWRALTFALMRVNLSGGLEHAASALAYLYLLAFGFAILLDAVCFYNLSAKRFRDRGLPAYLAGLVLVAALFAAAAHWLQPLMQGDEPVYVPLIFDALTLILAAWTVAELGTRAGIEEQGQ